MRRYRRGFWRKVFWLSFITLAVLSLVAVRRQLYELLCDNCNLLLSRSIQFTTAEDRARYAARHPESLRIAVVGDWSADERRAPRRHADLKRAFDEVNARKAAGARRLEVEWFDVGGSADVLQQTAFRLAKDPAYFALVTALDDAQIVAIKPILLRGRLVTLSPGVTTVRAAGAGDLPYLHVPNASCADIAATLAESVAKVKDARVGLIQFATLASASLAAELQNALAQRSVKTVVRQSASYTVPVGPQFEHIRGDVQYRDCNVAVMATALQGTSWRPQALDWFCNCFHGRIYACRPLPLKYMDRISFVSVVPDRKKVEKQLPEAYAHQDVLAYLSCRAVWLLADACAKAKAPTPDALIAALRDETLDSPFGPFRFSPDRFEANPPLSVVESQK